MPEKRTVCGRSVAVEALTKFDKTGKNSTDILRKIINKTNQKAKASDMVFGTIRNRNLIDGLLEKFCDVHNNRVCKELLNILRAGVYELVYCPSIEQYAVVNETVALAMNKKQRGFVNAVLRNICRAIENRQVPYDINNPKILPQTPQFGCQFTQEILPYRNCSLDGYLSEAFSIPKWLASEWVDQFGPDKAAEVCLAGNRRCGLYLQPNTLKTTPSELVNKLKHSAVDAQNFQLVCNDKIIKASNCGEISALPGFAEGLFTVQDPTAAKAPESLKPIQGEVIMDMCAAPGGKTARIAQLINNTGTVIATDIDRSRLKKVKENCLRLGITCVKTIAFEDIGKVTKNLQINAILADVPCSNSGVMAKRCEVRYRINKNSIKELCRTQLGILNKAAGLLKTGGRICYSTCSITESENHELVDKFISENSNFELISENLTLPAVKTARTVDRDGGYVALLTKK